MARSKTEYVIESREDWNENTPAWVKRADRVDGEPIVSVDVARKWIHEKGQDGTTYRIVNVRASLSVNTVSQRVIAEAS